MTKPFHKWVSDISGTVPDNTWTGNCIDNHGKPEVQELTKAQIRMYFADDLIDYKKFPDEWTRYFFLALIDKNNMAFITRGSKLYRAYNEIDDPDERDKWLERLRDKIKSGKVRSLYE